MVASRRSAGSASSPDGRLEDKAPIGDLPDQVHARGRRHGGHQRHRAVVLGALEQRAQGRAQNRGSPALLLRQLLEDLDEKLRLVLAADFLRRGFGRLFGSPERQIQRRQEQPRLLEGLPALARFPGLDRLGQEPPRRLRAEQTRDVELHDPLRRKEGSVEQRVRDRLDRSVVLEAEDLGAFAREDLPRAARRLLDEELHVAGHQDRGRSVGELRDDLVGKRRLGHEAESNATRKNKAPVGETDGGLSSKGT